ncbi:MAG: PqqD family protein [Myxococcota bacterium]
MPDRLQYRISPAVASTELDGEVTILDPRSGLYFGLEDVGGEVWRLLARPHTVRGICAALMDRFEVGPEECESDVVELLQELVDRGLVEVV